MKKLLFAMAAMIMAMSANAQIVSSTSKSIKRTVTATTEVVDDTRTRFGIDLSVGSINYGEGYNRGSFGLGLRWVKPLGKYVGLDIASINWTASFSEPGPADMDFLSVKTGVRGFSPRFGKNMRGFANLDLGYGGILVDEACDYYSAFALEFGAGIYLNDHITVGYALNYETKCETKQHFFRIGFLF